MNRRGFLGMLVGGLATAAAVRTFPFRVFSFPKEIKPVNMPPVPEEYWREMDHVLDSARYACGVFSVVDNFLVHPEQLEALKRLGYVRPVTLGSFRVEAPPIIRELVPDMPNLYPLAPERPRNPFAYPSRRQRS